MKERVVEKVVKTIAIPHDWTVRCWPRDVYPYDGGRARHVIRVHQGELLAAGALTRIGRELVVMGAGYSKWLAANARRVTEWAETEVAANRDEHAAKRFGGGAKRGRGSASGADIESGEAA